MGWAFLYMFVLLKLPLAFMLWLIWWAVHEQPVPSEEEDSDDSGGGGERRHPRPRRPRPPRRGPHVGPGPSAPRRMRVPERTPYRRVRS
jgi:hypothetical protein